jgi:hypothetical protein
MRVLSAPCPCISLASRLGDAFALAAKGELRRGAASVPRGDNPTLSDAGIDEHLADRACRAISYEAGSRLISGSIGKTRRKICRAGFGVADCDFKDESHHLRFKLRFILRFSRVFSETLT